jgi:hypothetical protein
MLMTLCLSDGHAIGVAHDPPAAVERSSPPPSCALSDAKSRVSRSADLTHGTDLDKGRLDFRLPRTSGRSIRGEHAAARSRLWRMSAQFRASTGGA